MLTMVAERPTQLSLIFPWCQTFNRGDDESVWHESLSFFYGVLFLFLVNRDGWLDHWYTITFRFYKVFWSIPEEQFWKYKKHESWHRPIDWRIWRRRVSNAVYWRDESWRRRNRPRTGWWLFYPPLLDASAVRPLPFNRDGWTLPRKAIVIDKSRWVGFLFFQSQHASELARRQAHLLEWWWPRYSRRDAWT